MPHFYFRPKRLRTIESHLNIFSIQRVHRNWRAWASVFNDKFGDETKAIPASLQDECGCDIHFVWPLHGSHLDLPNVGSKLPAVSFDPFKLTFCLLVRRLGRKCQRVSVSHSFQPNTITTEPANAKHSGTDKIRIHEPRPNQIRQKDSVQEWDKVFEHTSAFYQRTQLCKGAKQWLLRSKWLDGGRRSRRRKQREWFPARPISSCQLRLFQKEPQDQRLYQARKARPHESPFAQENARSPPPRIGQTQNRRVKTKNIVAEQTRRLQWSSKLLGTLPRHVGRVS